MMKKISIWLIILSLLVFSDQGWGGKEVKKMDVRRSILAGSWYPADAGILARDLERYLRMATVSAEKGKLLALIVPHAGYMYSGPVAAWAYKNIQGRSFSTVVMVGPSHRAYFQGVAAYARGAWETPFGRVPIDEQLARELIDCDPEYIHDLPTAHAQEHSLEIQVPFLQHVLQPGFKILPLMIFDHSLSACQRLARALTQTLRRRESVLLLASTDLSHFHNDAQAKKLDALVARHVAGFDPEGLARDLAANKCEACGGGPMVAVMLAARELGADRAVIFDQRTSGDVTGDRSQVVGYLAAGIYNTKIQNTKIEGQKTGAVGEERHRPGKLTLEEKKELFRIARAAVEAAVKRKKRPDLVPLTDALAEKRGVFVTLKIHGQLRGCIGYIEAIKPLYLAVADMAREAAVGDPRFPPVSEKELPLLEYEISVLTPKRQIADPSEFVVGKHGIIVERDGRGGVFLPQVAPEQGWDREQTLTYLCLHKAGLPADAWKDKRTKLFVFEAEVLEE